MTNAVEQEKPEKLKKFNWWWPAGVLATSLGGMAVVAFRGCWHRKMSWPVGVQGYSYQGLPGLRRHAAFRRENLQRIWPVPL